MGKRGPVAKNILYRDVIRIALPEDFKDLLPFWQAFKQLPHGERNRVLFTAIRSGAEAAKQVLSSSQNSQKLSDAIDEMIGAFDDE